LWNEWTTEGLAFGFTTPNRWWKAGWGIALRLCGGNVIWWSGVRVLHCDYVVEMW
ncbi:hypothetical protein T02_4597, partial [Trichinella nativa]